MIYEDFGITKEEAKLMRLRFLERWAENLYARVHEVYKQTDRYRRKRLSEAKNEQSRLVSLSVNHPEASALLLDDMAKLAQEINSLEFLLSHNKSGASLEQIKEISIGTVINIKPDRDEKNKAVYKCLFHNEKTASMTWFKKDNRYHCFGCGAHGSVIDIYAHIHNLSIKDAIKELRKRCG